MLEPKNHRERIYLNLERNKLDVLKRIFIVLAILAGVYAPFKDGIAQNEFRHYSSDEGFTGSAFKTMLQDSLGFLWISSNSLVFKFDGFTFTPYRVPSTFNSSSGNLYPIQLDRAGGIWVAGANSIANFDRDQEKFTTYFIPIDGYIPETVWFEDNGQLWLGAPGAGLISLDPSTKQHTAYQNTKSKFPSDANTVRTIEGIGDHLLLGTNDGLWKFSKTTKEFSRPTSSLSDTTLISKGAIRRIFTGQHEYWIWTDHQLAQFDARFSLIKAIDFEKIQKDFDHEKKVGTVTVASIDRDAAGIFWIAFQGLGLGRYDPSNGRLTNFRHDPAVPSSLPSDVLYYVFVDRDQNVWVTTVNKGIAQLKQRSITFYNYLPGISTTGMALVKGTGTTRLVTGSNGNGLWTTQIDTKQPGDLNFERLNLGNIKGFESSIEISMGRERLWVGSLSAGVAGLRVDKQRGQVDLTSPLLFQHDGANFNTISENFITSVLEGPNGRLWAGTFRYGLNEIDLSAEYGKPGSAIRYHLTNSDTVFEDHIPDILIEPDKTILAATSQGIFSIDPDSRKADLISPVMHCNKIFRTSDGALYAATKTGLMECIKSPSGKYTFKPVPLRGSPFVTAVQEDRLGRIWCSSFQGLFFYDRDTQFVRVFKKEDGLPSSRTVNAAGAVQTAEGMMIFSNAEGITAFDPLSLRLSTVAPRPMFTQLRINNSVVTSADTDSKDLPHESINTLKELTLNYTQNILTIEFSAMDFTSPEKNEYKYKLEGFDKDWVHADWKNRTATYTNLKPDNYTFIVVASNSDGVWGTHEATIKIRVLPPPWKTWWAYSLYGLIIAAILFVVRRNIIKHERLASKLALEHVELEKVQEIDRAKTNFFANISHEFRTPLTLIQGPVQNLMEKFKGDAGVKDQLNLVQQNSDRLLRLVNQILELARLESGTLKNETSETSIVLFLKQIVGSFSAFAIQKKITFIQQFPEFEVCAQFDKDKLEKITSNLISNALKFTPEQGAVIVNVSVTVSNGSGELTFRVTDTGKGVPEDQQSKIFERFYQVSEDGNINVGSGIGLALCKELAEFLGGSLTLESKVGEGSRFTLSLPLETAEQVSDVKQEEHTAPIYQKEEIHVNGTAHPDEQVEKPIILVVEDHADLRKFIIACLGSDYNFVEASNGREGLHHAIEQIPTLILSDVMMPEMDGMEMCHKIKSDQRTSHIPVILLTAKASEQSKLSGLGIGADDYIVKPFNKDELKLKIRNQVAARSRMQERVRLEFLSENTTIKAVSADEKFLERLRKIVETRMSDELLGVESLTEEIGMSRAQLYRKVTALTGLSGNEFIRKLRLQRAAQLLQQQTGSVSQVAYEVGFSNLSYFSKCFKEQFGVLPSEYGAKAHTKY